MNVKNFRMHKETCRNCGWSTYCADDKHHTAAVANTASWKCSKCRHTGPADLSCPLTCRNRPLIARLCSRFQRHGLWLSKGVYMVNDRGDVWQICLDSYPLGYAVIGRVGRLPVERVRS